MILGDVVVLKKKNKIMLLFFVKLNHIRKGYKNENCEKLFKNKIKK